MRLQQAKIGLKIVERPRDVEASLWRRFCFENDADCRAQLFKKYSEFAKMLANKEYSRRPRGSAEISDFYQLAFAGLLEAIDRYDPMKNVPFKYFAKHRIVGSISDGMKSASEKNAQYFQIERASEARMVSLIGETSISDNPLEKLTEIVVGLAVGYVMDEVKSLEVEAIADSQPNAYQSLAWRELILAVKKAIKTLPGKESFVIDGHYLKGLAFLQIANLLKLTKGRVSQIHKSGIQRLRKKLKKYYSP